MNDAANVSYLQRFQQEVLNDPLASDIWNAKYRFWKAHKESDEASVGDTKTRVVNAIYALDDNELHKALCLQYVHEGLLIPAGRILAGAGTGRSVTEINCFVLPTVQDSMPGIQLAIAQGALTMQQGGGIGIDFSTVRPYEALVGRTGSIASGVISFADQMDGMCLAIASAGARRGAMMMTLSCTHPDLYSPDQYETYTDHTGRSALKHPTFISAKRQVGRLTQFNMSVLATDAFIKAVANDEMWDLGFHVPRADGKHVDVYEKPFPYNAVEMENDFSISAKRHGPRKGDLIPWYVYQRVKARTIWTSMMRSTYEHSEPGIIYIDQINFRNNLNYCEEISTTNPCGEQPLPPNGCCNLSSINAAFFVNEPFTPHASFDFDRFAAAAEIGVRMLDNVLDIANFPLIEQKQESDLKRRVGLGVTGWGDALVQLGLRYGSDASVKISREAAKTMKAHAYKASIALAQERGPFPLYDRDQFMQSPNVKALPKPLLDQMAEHGIRNGCLLSIAPTGTISLFAGNVSSGHEPVFSFNKSMRKVRQPNGELKEYQSVDYAYRLWEHLRGTTPRDKLPDYFVGAMDISAMDHVKVHATWQDHIDAACSKTINCAADMPYEEFCDIYSACYELGAKGCTTYRPNPESGRGSVLSEVKPLKQDIVLPRPKVLAGYTHKLKWLNDNWYITINKDDAGVPREIFIVTQDVSNQEWVTALTRTITALLRRGGDIGFLVDELAQVHSANGGQYIDQSYCPSVVAAIGRVLRHEFSRKDDGLTETTMIALNVIPQEIGESCPKCHSPTLIKEQGCKRCLSCDFSTC